MEKFYRTNLKKFLLIMMGLFSTAQLVGQTYTETFDGSNSTRVSSLNRTTGGVQFNFLFTTDGDGGDFVLFPQYGVSNGPSLDLRSFDFITTTTEKVSITRTDGQLFVFTSLFIRNDTGSPITVQGYSEGSTVGAPAVVATAQETTVNSGAVVDEVQLTATDFFNVNLDNFTWSVPVFSAPTVTTSAAISVDASSATLGGNVTADGGAAVTARGFVYSVSDATPTLGEGGVANLTSGSGTGTFSGSATGLNASTTYYYQAYATNSEGTVYGGVQGFTTTALPVLLSTNPILSFSSNSGFGDKIAGDGDGGSVSISDINIQAYPINNAGTHLNTGLLEYHDGSEPDWAGYPAIIVYGAESNTTFYGWSIKSESGVEFTLNSLDFHDWGNYDGATFTIEAYKDGISKATYDFTGNTGGSYVSLSNPGNLPGEFSDVDEIRIYQADGADSYIALNNVGVGSPVPALPNTAPIATAPSAPTVNEDAVNVALSDDIQIADVDGDDQAVSFTVTGGTLTVGTTGVTFAGSGNGSANFTASGTLANINAALDAATFTPTPNLYGTNAGIISFVSNDGTVNSNTASVTFDIAGVNDAPVVSNTTGNVFWTEGDPATVVKPLIGVSDPDGDNITKAIITNLLFVSGDVLSVATPGPYSVDYNTSTGVLTLSGIGTATEMQNALRTVDFRNSTDDPGLGNTRNTRIVSIFVEDDNAATSAAVDNPGIFISSVNDAPSVTLPGPLGVIEDADSPLTGISFADVDAGSIDVSATFSVPNGTLSASSGGGVTVTGSGSGDLTFTGSLAAINGFIAGSNLNFLNEPGNTGDQNLTVSINDNGNTGSGGALQDNGTVTLTVTPNPPVVTSVSVPANGTYGVLQNLDFTINFDEDISVNTAGGVPALSLTIGSATREATYISGSGTAALVFRYTVQNGDLDANGIQVNSLSANGATLRNGDGTDADLSLNNVGNTSAVNIDGVAPSGYSISIDQDPILVTDHNAVGFTFAGAEIGATYNYTFSSSGGGTNVSGNGTIASATDQIAGIDLSSLNAGTVTLTVTLEDPYGNIGSEVTDMAAKLSSITAQIIAQTNIACNGGSEGSITVQVNGGIADYSYSWSNGASTSNSSSATNTISSLTAGDYSVTVTDGNGQEATAIATITEPDIASVTTTAASNITSSSAALGGTVAYSDANCENESGIVYSTTPDPTLSDTKIVMPVTAGSFGQEVAGLQVNTTYYVRAFSTNDNDVTVYGSEINFTTSTKILTVTADAGQSKVYGGTDPVFTYTATGFENGDDESILSGALTREAGEDVGSYAIQLGTLDAGPNYTINIIGADFAITPATLDVTADAGQSKVFGGNDPTITYTATGFANGDDESMLSGALTREAGEALGNYSIQLGTLSAGANYTINFTGADFAITPATLDVTANTGQSKVYGDTDPVFTYSATGFANGDDESMLSGALTREAGEDVGSYAIQLGTLSAGSKYTINFTGADFAITPATLDVTANTDQSKVYGDTDPVFTYSATGFANGDDESMLSGALTREAGEALGSYAILLGTLSAGSNYTINFAGADFTIALRDITGTTFEDGSFVYDGTAKSLSISGSLPAGTTVTYDDNGRTDVGSQEVTATITGSSYNTLVLTADLTVTPADITGVTFDDASFVFDGTAKSLAITGTLPDGTSVAYTGNTRTDVGTQEVTATITGDNYEELVLTADLTVTPADVTGITLGDGSFVYDGTAKSLAIAGELPDGTTVTYTGNTRTDVGTQEVTATISGDNYETLVLTADLTITEATISGISLEDGSFVYDGTAKSLAIAGELPDGTTVTYTGNSRTDVGTQEVTATISGDNYETLVLTADLTITEATISGISLEDGSFVYDGMAKSLAIAGELPDGTTVTYTGNSRTDVGTQEVTATITGDNYDDLVLMADLSITPATRGIEFAAIPVRTYGDAEFDAGATASSGEPVTYTSSDPSVVDVTAGGLLRVTGAGEATITATVPENGNYTTRPQASRQLNVRRAAQSIAFSAPAEVDRDAGTIPLDVSASSGLPVSLSIDDEEVATLGGTSLNILRLGTVRITATQAGDANHEPAEPVTIAVRVIDPASDMPIRIHKAVSPNGDGINEYLIIEAIKDYPENRVSVFNRNGTVVYEISGYNNGTRAFRGIGAGQLRVPAGTYFYVAEIKVDGVWKYEKGWFVLRY